MSGTTQFNPREHQPDYLAILQTAELVATSAYEGEIYDFGESAPHRGVIDINISAVEIASNDERYVICVMGSDVATVDSALLNLGMMEFGALETLISDEDSVVGNYKLPFQCNQKGTSFRYIRLYVIVEGTIATGINFTASLIPQYGRI